MKRWTLVGLLAFSAALSTAACGDSTGGSGGSGGTAASSTTTASSSSSSTGTGGTGGGTGGSGGGGTAGGSMAGTGGAGGGTGGSGGSGGGNVYTTCSDCTAEKGAPMNECKAEHDACFTMKDCVLLYNCNYFGLGGGPGPCESTQDGACCSLQCDKASGATPEAIAAYRALDQCIYCKTCASLCDTSAYCKVFEPGGDVVCK